MHSSTRIVVNTIAQYGRTIINLLLSLYSSRLVLNILGVDDYGIYALVAGVVSMLSFITNSLVGSTQRFLSVAQGKGDIDNLKSIFSNCLLLHVGLGLLVVIVLELLTPYLFNGFLNIPDGRNHVASLVYQQVIIMVYTSFVASPYRALLVSRENIVYTSIIDVMDGVLKVLLVLMLPFVAYDKLLVYGWIMLVISVFNFLAFAIYSHRRYEECIFPRLRLFTLRFWKELFSYTGWVVYSTVCVTLRTQGLAVVLNRVMGTKINAAYGIGSQISGMVSFVSSSFSTAISPQLMAAEGKQDRQHMWLLASLQSKYSFLLLAMIGVPVMFEMQQLLQIWLGSVPHYATLFGCMFILMQIVDMLTSGLGMANRAIGNIAWYTIITYTPKLFILPISWYLLERNASLYVIVFLVIMVEAVCMMLRIPLLLNEKGFKARKYFVDVFIRSFPPVIVSVMACYALNVLDVPFRFLLTFIVSVSLFMFVAYKYSLGDMERQKLVSLCRSALNRVRK